MLIKKKFCRQALLSASEAENPWEKPGLLCFVVQKTTKNKTRRDAAAGMIACALYFQPHGNKCVIVDDGDDDHGSRSGSCVIEGEEKENK